MDITTIGIDLAKLVFRLHGVEKDEQECDIGPSSA
jgi:hypothetical protein